MACFLGNEDDVVLEGNLFFWRIREWPYGLKEISKEFGLHGKRWRYSAVLRDECFSICIRKLDEGGPEDHLFDMQAGIVGDSRREMAAVKEEKFSNTYRLMSLSDFYSSLRTNRDVYLFVEISKKENAQKKKAPKQKIEMDFAELLFSGNYSDVILEVQGQEFRCHSFILGVRSPVLAAMFEHDMKEKSSGVVAIKDAEPALFQEFLLYLYSGYADHLNWDRAAGLYKLADKYNIDDLKSVCRDEMQENIDKDNFFEVVILSQLYSDSELKEMAIKFFLREKEDILNDEYWITFLSEYPVESEIVLKSLDDEIKKMRMQYLM